MATALEQLMANPDAAQAALGTNPENGTRTERVSAPPASSDNESGKERGAKVKAEGFTPEELDLLSGGKKGPGTKKEEKPDTIAGTPYVTVEQLGEGYKNLQRENARLHSQIEKELPSKIQSGIQAELQKILADSPPPVQETEEEKALKQDDPDAYEVLQLKKQLVQQNEHLNKVYSEIQGMKQQGQVQKIEAEFRKVSAEKKVPFNALMAYGSLKQYANTSAEDLADIVREELGLDQPGPSPKPPVNADEIRPPARGGASVVSVPTFNGDDLGELGSKKWKQTEKVLKKIFLNRTAGGSG